MDYLGYYKTRGVSEDSSYPDIRKAYRRLAKRHHPDKNTSGHSGDMIKLINAAFEILSDKDKRKQYDVTRPIQNGGLSTEIDVAKKARQSYDGFEIPTRGPNYSRESTVYPNQNENQTSTDYAFKEWKHEKFGYRQSTRFRKDPSVNIGVQVIDEETSKPPAHFHISVEPTLCMAVGSCEVLAPKVFVLEKNKIINPKVRIESEGKSNKYRLCIQGVEAREIWL
ncbi:MAG: DnaJ domain-containing protein [Nitrososphaeraceae archaeon]